MLALDGVRARSPWRANPRFQTLAHTSCEERFRENEAEVVHGGGEEVIQLGLITE